MKIETIKLQKKYLKNQKERGSKKDRVFFYYRKWKWEIWNYNCKEVKKGKNPRKKNFKTGKKRDRNQF